MTCAENPRTKCNDPHEMLTWGGRLHCPTSYRRATQRYEASPRGRYTKLVANIRRDARRHQEQT